MFRDFSHKLSHCAVQGNCKNLANFPDLRRKKGWRKAVNCGSEEWLLEDQGGSKGALLNFNSSSLSTTFLSRFQAHQHGKSAVTCWEN